VGNCLAPIEFGKILKGGSEGETTLLQVREFSAKAGRQVVKDYVALPALTSLSPAATYKSTLMANGVANVLPQHLGQRGDLLWAFPRRRREIHEDRRLIRCAAGTRCGGCGDYAGFSPRR
jgi:hypothetical protein